MIFNNIMSKYLYTSNSKSQNVKFIIITALVTLVILGIAVWAVVFMVSHSREQAGTTEAEIAAEPAGSAVSEPEVVSTADATDPTETPEDATGAEGVSESADDTSKNSSDGADASETTNSTANGTTGDSTSTGSASSATVPTAGSVPDTGPTDFLPLALLAGALVAYGASRSLAEERI